MVETVPGERVYSFHGGLKLRHNKKISCAMPLERPPMPQRLWVVLQQHQGETGELLVEAGEQVRKGQALTRAVHDRQVPVHAPTSGLVRGIVDHPVASPPGSLSPAVELEPDDRDFWSERTPLDRWRERAPEEIIEHLRERGLAGLGGAQFPTAAKLRGKWPPIHTLILNGAECEPYISCDEMLMRERPAAIVEGGVILARAVGAERVVIGIEDQMGAVEWAFGNVRRKVDPENRVRVVKVTTIYPEGGEKQIIQVLTGREVPHDGLPQDMGIVCLNVATAAAARDAVIEGTPVIERVVTVTGPGIVQPRNLIALIGTPFFHLVQAANGYRPDVARLVLGGPMSGLPLATDVVTVTKGANCILALTEKNIARTQPELPCINCGECVRVCPAQLLPQELFHYLRAGDYDEARELNLYDCIECGCCAFVCPSHIPLVDYYRLGKEELRLRDAEIRRSRLARGRYEARETRLEVEREAREAGREARADRLRHADTAAGEVQAAIERARKKRGEGRP